MMWRSVKALDLFARPPLRRPQHGVQPGRHGGRVQGLWRAVEVNDPEERRRFGDAVFAAIGFRPEEPEFHCFAISIESVVFSHLRDSEFHRQVWKAGQT